MLLMRIWSPHHAVTTTLVEPDLECQMKSWSTAGCQMIPSCSGWGSHPLWHDYQIHSEHINCNWQILYAVDGDMEPPPCCYYHTCGTGFGKLAEQSWITAGCQNLHRVRVHSYAPSHYWKVFIHLIHVQYGCKMHSNFFQPQSWQHGIIYSQQWPWNSKIAEGRPSPKDKGSALRSTLHHSIKNQCH